MSEWVVYHFREEGNDDLSDGYIGACNDLSKRRYHHLNDPVNNKTKRIVESNIVTEFVILYRGTEDECFALERDLRPIPDVGWNLNSGGKNAIYSDESKKRMSDLKKGKPNGRSGEKHPLYGRTGEKSARFGTRGTKHPHHKGFWVTPLGRFGSTSLAAEAHKVSKNTVRHRCLVSKNFTEWFFEENEDED